MIDNLDKDYLGLQVGLKGIVVKKPHKKSSLRGVGTN
jgi:hypothetical protein